MLVPAVAARNDQIDAYFRMAASFIASSCSNGQLLILQGSSDVDVDAPSLTQVANSACAVANVQRTEITVQAGERATQGFELRCTILKHRELVQQLENLERADPMAALRNRLMAAVERAEGRGQAAGNTK
jgi:hypothetical protein